MYQTNTINLVVHKIHIPKSFVILSIKVTVITGFSLPVFCPSQKSNAKKVSHVRSKTCRCPTSQLLILLVRSNNTVVFWNQNYYFND